MKRIVVFVPLAAVLLSACVVMPPSGPSRLALPGSRQSFEQFQLDDVGCRQYAISQIGGRGAAEHAQESAAASAVAGTLIGAAAGAAIGGRSDAAVVGAGIGFLTGAMAGLGASEASYHTSQQRFDSAYFQCMYARGHKVPVSARYAQQTRVVPLATTPPMITTPPPDAAVPPPDAPPPPAPYTPPYWPSVPPPR